MRLAQRIAAVHGGTDLRRNLSDGAKPANEAPQGRPRRRSGRLRLKQRELALAHSNQAVALAAWAANGAGRTIEQHAQGNDRSANGALLRGYREAKLLESPHGDASMHVHSGVALDRRASTQAHDHVVEANVLNVRGRAHSVCWSSAGEVVQVNLEKPQLALSRARRELATLLQGQPISLPPLAARRQRIRRVKLPLQVLGVSSHKR